MMKHLCTDKKCYMVKPSPLKRIGKGSNNHATVSTIHYELVLVNYDLTDKLNKISEIVFQQSSLKQLLFQTISIT